MARVVGRTTASTPTRPHQSQWEGHGAGGAEFSEADSAVVMRAMNAICPFGCRVCESTSLAMSLIVFGHVDHACGLWSLPPERGLDGAMWRSRNSRHRGRL